MFIYRCIQFFKRKYKAKRFKKCCPNLLCLYKDVIFNEVVDKGFGNQVVVKEGGGIVNSKIYFWGNNCILYIGRNTRLHDCQIWFEDNGGRILIGDNTTAETGCELASCEGKEVRIGDDCMLARSVDIRNTDSHSILNGKGERINPAADIKIGNHVWIGIRSTILKGVVIPDNCVIGAQSMVTGSLKANEHSLIVGNPAKVIKHSISWDRKRL